VAKMTHACGTHLQHRLPTQKQMAGPLVQAFLSSRSGVLALLLLLPRVSHEITTHKEIWWKQETGIEMPGGSGSPTPWPPRGLPVAVPVPFTMNDGKGTWTGLFVICQERGLCVCVT
jgi:hypothetical protein